MQDITLLSLLSSSNYLVVNKSLIQSIGLLEAVLLCEFASEHCYWANCDKLDDGYFYSTIKNVEDNTGLSSRQQRALVKTLKDIGLIDIQLKGLPAKRYIKINEEALILHIKMLQNVTTRSDKTAQLDATKCNINNNNKEIINKSNNKYTYEQRQSIIARLSALYHRRQSTAWSDKEIKALDKVLERDDVLQELDDIEDFYIGGYRYRRRDILTLLNNWTTELDRAANRIEEQPPKPANVHTAVINDPVWAPDERGLQKAPWED